MSRRATGGALKNFPDVTEYVSGGYFIVLPAKRAPCMNATLLPTSIVTASDCIVDHAPNTWSIAWVGHTEASRLDEAANFAMNADDLAAFTGWCTAALESGDLVWPGVFVDIDVARWVRARFLSKAQGLVLIGIALAQDLVETFVEETRVEVGHGEPGVVTAIRRGNSPSPGGAILGFDVLGWDGGGFHSYICNGLEMEFLSTFGIRPNRHGFFDQSEEARRCAEHSNLETTGAEPALWLPWLTLLYDGALGD